MNVSYRQTIANDLAGLERLMTEATAFMEKEQVDAQAVYRINLALEEMISNIIKYGYDDAERHEIAFSLTITDDEVVAVIEDDGHDFDPLLQPVKGASVPLEEREIGGLGIELIRKLLDRLVHRREKGRNVLEIGAHRILPGRPA